LGSRQASFDFIVAAIEVISEEVTGKITIFEAAINDQAMPGFPANRIIWPAQSDCPHNVINDVNQRRSGGFEAGEPFQGRVAALLAEILDLRVKGIFAGKMLIEECLGNARGLSKLAGGSIGKALSSEQRQDGFDYGSASLISRHALLLDHNLS
jgi:hypothetical protein